MGMEIERKFLVKYLPDLSTVDAHHLIQGYIKKDPSGVVRVRTDGSKGFITIKGPKTNISGIEFEYEIPGEDARTLLRTFCGSLLIEKRRYCLTEGGSEWAIDQFLNKNQGLILAEIELDAEDQLFDKPDWLGPEVSRDPKYYNSNLVDYPFTRWPETA